MAAADAGIGSLGVKLSVDTADFSAGLDRAAQISQREMRRIERANQTAAKEVDRLAAQVQRQIDTFGLSGTALLRYEAQVKGATDRVGPLIDRLEALKRGVAANDAAFAAGARGLSQYGISAGQTAAAMRTLPAQFTDIATQLAGGQSPFLVLLQQGGQIKDQFGGIGAAFEGLTSVITPTRAAIAALVATAAGLSYVFSTAAADAAKLQQGINLSGNFAGITAGQFETMARSIADSVRTTTGAAREAVEGLVATGNVGPRLMRPMAEAVALTMRVTGEAADKTVADFAKMSDGVVKWAAEHNRSLNFITAAELEHVRALEEAGRKTDAQLAVLDAYSRHVGGAAQQTSFWSERVRFLSNDLDNLLRSINRVMTGGTLDDRLAAADRRVREFADYEAQSRQPAAGSAEAAQRSARRTTLQNDRDVLAAIKEGEEVKAVTDAASAATQKAGSAAREYHARLLGQARGLGVVNEELAKYRKHVEAAALAGAPISRNEQAQAEAQIRKNFAGPKGPRASTRTPQQDDPARQQRDNALRGEERALALSREAAQQHNRLLELDNARGLLSIQSYYDARREIMENATAQQVAIYDRQIAALVAYRDRQKRATDRAETQGRVDEVEERRAKLLRETAFAATEMGEQQTAAQEALQRAVADVNAELLQLQGNLAAAAAVRFDATNAPRRQVFENNGETGARDRLDAVRRLTIAQAAYSQQQTEAQRITEQLGITEARVALSERLGATTTLGAMRQVGAARQEAVRQMEAIVAAQEAIARASESPALVLQAERSRLALEELRGSADVAGDRVRAIFDTATADAFSGFIGGTKSASQAFQAFADSILRDLSRIASQQITSGLTGGKGGWMDQIVKAVGSYIGGGSTQGATVSPVEYMGYADGGAFDRGGEVRFASGGVVTRATPFKFASGGSFRSGVMGEAGPEAIMPLARGPNGKLGVVAQGAGKGGDVYVVVENHGGSQVEQRETTRPDGSREIRLIIEAAKAAVAEDVRREGGIASALQSTYGLNRGVGVMRGR